MDGRYCFVEHVPAWIVQIRRECCSAGAKTDGSAAAIRVALNVGRPIICRLTRSRRDGQMDLINTSYSGTFLCPFVSTVIVVVVVLVCQMFQSGTMKNGGAMTTITATRLPSICSDNDDD